MSLLSNAFGRKLPPNDGGKVSATDNVVMACVAEEKVAEICQASYVENRFPDVPKTVVGWAMQARMDLLKGSPPRVAALTEFVRALRAEAIAANLIPSEDHVPHFDPLDGEVEAGCLFLFEAPGPRAVGSGFVSRDNPDETAKNFFFLNREAGLPDA